MSDSQCSPVCKTVKWISALLLLLMVVLAAMGVWKTHVVGGSLQFGLMANSLAILAFAISLVLFKKQLGSCMKKYCDICDAK